MKTFKLFSMAALALTMAACSNEDNELENVPPAQQGTMHFTATVAAPGSGATTRTTYTEVKESTDPDYGKIKVAWNVGDKIALVHNGVVDEAEVTKVDDVTGSATIDAPTITGKPSDNDEVKLVYPAYAVGSVSSGTSFSLAPAVFGYMLNQDGTLEFIQNNLDFRWGPSQLAVSGSDATLKTSVEMSSAIVIWKLTLTTDGSTPLSATKVTIKNGSKTQAATTTISATSEVYLALPFIGSYDNLTIEATVGSDTYAYIAPGSVSVTEGKYYQSTVTMKKMKTTLSLITSDYTAQDGDILTGTLGSNVKISIADGATVTLKDMDINGSGTWEDGDYAGITCEGSATIILEGTNSVKGFYEDYPGIYVPDSKTLTIDGTGSLTASSNGFGAGIGGGNDIDCGNIEIKGGEITAGGGSSYGGSAGIGGGSSASCGNITISGGTVTASSNGYGAGIGGGQNGICGTITINGGTVTASGNSYGAGIGCGYAYGDDTECGNILISGGTVTATGGENAAGIGCGYAELFETRCGNILISGGTVTATGGEKAAGIGGGLSDNPDTTCGTITINNTVTKLTATKGSDARNSIGPAGVDDYVEYCGTVTIGGTVYWNYGTYVGDGATYLATSPLTYPAAP